MEKSQLKNKIIKEQLPNLSIDPLGYYVDAEELSERTYDSYEEYYYDSLPPENIDPEDILSENDFQEIKRRLINNIKENAKEWKIESEGTLTIIKHTSGKKHYKEGFEEKEWENFNQILSDVQQQNELQEEQITLKGENEGDPVDRTGVCTSENNLLKKENKINDSSIFNGEVAFVPRKWLTDQEIEFALKRIEAESVSNHIFISSYEWPLIKSNSDEQANARLFSELAKQEKELVFIPINNPNTHWSLLVYKTKQNKFYHLDSSQEKINSNYIKDIVNHLCQHKNAEFAELNVPLQPNSYDCGIYLITFVKLLSDNPELSREVFPEIDSDQERTYWREIVSLNNLNDNEETINSSSENNLPVSCDKELSLGNSVVKWINWRKDEREEFKEFDEETTQQWINKKFSKEQAKEWLKSGLQSTDAKFSQWIRGDEKDIKKINNTERSLEQENEKGINAQKWLDQNFPKNQRNKINKLIISGWDSKNERENPAWIKLTGKLDLSDFVNLRELDCSNNMLTNLEISKCSKLTSLKCFNNQLVDIPIEINQLPQPKKLICLNISNNNLPAQDLTFLAPFTGLEDLRIGDYHSSVYVPLYGSLEPLKNMNKLRYLDISFTDINSGLEYLPESLERTNKFRFNPGKTQAKVAKIDKELQYHCFLIGDWKKANPDLVNKAKKEKMAEQQSRSNLEILPKTFTKTVVDSKERFALRRNEGTSNISNIDNERIKRIISEFPQPKRNDKVISTVDKYLDLYYPKWSRKWIIALDISGWDFRNEREKDNWIKLVGKLDLSEFTRLKFLVCGDNLITELILPSSLQVLNCRGNQLTELFIPVDNQLKSIIASYNSLTNFNYQTLNPATLTALSLSNNNFEATDISVFDHLINLEELSIGSWDQTNIDSDIYNRFYGNWKNLKELKKLKLVEINNTDISSGVEYFPNSLTEICASTTERPDCELALIKKEIKERPIDAQEYIEQNYPKAKYWLWVVKYEGIDRNNITRLNLCGWDYERYEEKPNWKKLTNHLDLSGFVNLVQLDCSHNELTSLELKDNKQLIAINCSHNELTSLKLSNLPNLLGLLCDNNYLTKLNFSSLNPKLTDLIIPSNNFHHSDLSVFSRFENLEALMIGNNIERKINQNIYNRFTGSLKPLRNLTKLKHLDISNTDIDLGIEYLPRNNLEQFDHSFTKRPDSKVKELNVGNEEEMSTLFYRNRLNNIENDKNKDLLLYEHFSEFEKIGEGGFGTIYRTKWDHDLYPIIALKVLDKQKFNQEILFQELINHQIVTSFAVSNCHGITQDHDGNYALVMRYYENGNLRNYLMNNYKNTSEKLLFLMEVCRGLRGIHDKGLVHKDLHPGNVLIGNSNDKTKNKAFISDLGLSDLAYEQQVDKVTGVLPYVAPEVLLEGAYTKASDIYSFGMIMYEVLTGIVPHCREDWDNIDLQRKIVYDNFRPSWKIHQLKFPELLTGLVEKCWDKNPDNRPKVGELEKVISELTKDIDFLSQLIMGVEYNQNIRPVPTNSIDYHPSICYHSKLIDTNALKLKLGELNINENSLSLTEKKEFLEQQLIAIKNGFDDNDKTNKIIDQFLTLRQEFIKDKKNKKKEFKSFKESIRDNFSEKLIDELEQICDELVDLEITNNQQALIEQSPK